MTAIELRAVEAHECGGGMNHVDVAHLIEDLRRLRGLVKAVETIRHAGRGDSVEHLCPHCWHERDRNYAFAPQKHAADCPAFTADGSVK